MHTDWKTCSPVLSALAPALPPATATSATGLMRLPISSGDIAGLALSKMRPLVASCESSTMSTIGTTNASTSTVISCLGVLIGDWCESPLIGLSSVEKESAHYSACCDILESDEALGVPVLLGQGRPARSRAAARRRGRGGLRGAGAAPGLRGQRPRADGRRGAGGGRRGRRGAGHHAAPPDAPRARRRRPRH